MREDRVACNVGARYTSATTIGTQPQPRVGAQTDRKREGRNCDIISHGKGVMICVPAYRIQIGDLSKRKSTATQYPGDEQMVQVCPLALLCITTYYYCSIIT